MSRELTSTSGPRHVLVAVLAVVYGTFLAFVAFWPSPVDKPVQSQLSRVIQELHERGVPTFVDYSFIEFSANVVLFIPVGVIFGLAVPTRWWVLALLAGPALSASIEVAQWMLLSQRYATVYDVVANSIGSVIGVLLAVVLRAAVAMRDDKVIERFQQSNRTN